MLEHYQHFIIEATAMDRLCERERGPNKHHIANKAWSRHPTTLYTHMYELTDALCHNWWYVFSSFPFLLSSLPPHSRCDMVIRHHGITDRLLLIPACRKPAETEMWDSDDSDVPFSHPDDVPC